MSPQQAEEERGPQMVHREWFRWLEPTTFEQLVRHYRRASYWTMRKDRDWLLRLHREPTVDQVREYVRSRRPGSAFIGTHYGLRIGALQQLQGRTDTLMLGLGWISGTTLGDDGEASPVLFPLLRLHLTPRTARFTNQPRFELDADHPDHQNDLTLFEDMYRLIRWGPTQWHLFTNPPTFKALASRAGFPEARIDEQSIIPNANETVGEFTLIPRAATYLDLTVRAPQPVVSLAEFESTLASHHTAFHSIYSSSDSSMSPNDDRSFSEGRTNDPVNLARLTTASPLTTSQKSILLKGRDAAIQVVNGAPGTGKSHTIVTIVADAVHRGESVLVTARTPATIDALDALFRTEANIEPVAFGASPRHRQGLLGRLTDPGDGIGTTRLNQVGGQLAAETDRRNVALFALARHFIADAHRRGLTDDFTDAIDVALAASPDRARRVATLLAMATPDDDSRGRRQRRRYEGALRGLRKMLEVGANGTPDVSDAGVIAAAGLVVALGAVQQGNGSAFAQGRPYEIHDVSAGIAELQVASRAVEDAFVHFVRTELASERRLRRASSKSIAMLGEALRSGPSARRAELAAATDRDVTHAFPVWLGVLSDIDSLLPPFPGLFDLCIIDEASATEQYFGAGALLRSDRAVIVGDPHQLRPLSFVGQAEVASVLDEEGIEGADRVILDVARNSLLDAATSVCAPDILDEHFRSAPHLFDFVGRELYGDTVKVATRSPTTQGIDCIRVHDTRTRSEVPPARNAHGVVQAEIDAIIEVLQRRANYAGVSAGVITPFRAQADALESAVMEHLTPQQILDLNLRVGTVHGFQGNERGEMFVSLGLVDDDPAGWKFANDPNLLAVMLTRARELMTIVTSCTPDPSTLLGRYLAHCDQPPGPPPPAQPPSDWTERIAVELEAGGIEVMRSYPSGRHIVDLAFERDYRSVGVLTELPPGGVLAHIERHADLVHRGWEIHEILPAASDDDPIPHVLKLLTQPN